MAGEGLEEEWRRVQKGGDWGKEGETMQAERGALQSGRVPAKTP